MKATIQILLALFVFQFSNAIATTYLTFWINGESGHILNQGELFAWEFDVASPGNTVDVEFWLDLDESRGVSDGDFLLDVFTMTDGDDGNDGPADSSMVPDGLLYIELGPFGFAAQSYLLNVTDADESTVENWFEINEMEEPPAIASGTVSIEGKQAPDPALENIMIGAMGENGMFSGLTDQYGKFRINLTPADAEWEISSLFDRAVEGYISDDEGYRRVIQAGETGSLDFYFSRPKAYVYGSLLDQDQNKIETNGYIGLENYTTGQHSDAQVVDGDYVIPAPLTVLGQDSTNDFRMRIQEEMVFPDYLGPSHNNSFTVHYGDSIRKDLILFETNTVIHGFVTENTDLPSKSYSIQAYSDTLGYINVMSDPETAYFQIPVRYGSMYNVNIETDPEWGTPPPEGMVLAENWFYRSPEDTVRFNFVAADGLIRGVVNIDPGDPQEFDYDRMDVSVWDSTYTFSGRSRINEDNSFEVPVMNGTFSVALYPGKEYLAFPAEITRVHVNSDTVSNLNFMLNYAHATVQVHVINPPESIQQELWISSGGEWPNVYSAGSSQISPENVYEVKLCEGDWYIHSPDVMDGYYEVYPMDTVLTVTEQDSFYEVTFTYDTETSADSERNIIPAEYSLHQNYPNPFNPSTTISYELPARSDVEISVYNVLGQKLKTIYKGTKNAGYQTQIINMNTNVSGVYYYKIKAANFTAVRKMILLR